MITLDVTETSFIQDTTCEEANLWMANNIGKLIHDDPHGTYGVGWQLVWESECGRWVMQFDNDIYASLFILRWS